MFFIEKCKFKPTTLLHVKHNMKIRLINSRSDFIYKINLSVRFPQYKPSKREGWSHVILLCIPSNNEIFHQPLFGRTITNPSTITDY